MLRKLLGSLDVDSLFTNILLQETINICTNIIFENTERLEGLLKVEFKELLSLATKEFYFISDRGSISKSMELLCLYL